MSIAVNLVFLLSTYAPWLLLQQLWTRALTYSSSSQQAAAAAHRQGSTGARTRARVNSCIEYYRDQATLESASACRSRHLPSQTWPRSGLAMSKYGQALLEGWRQTQLPTLVRLGSLYPRKAVRAGQCDRRLSAM
ncbi:unnamed protein product [Sphagnum balticum]